MEKIKNERLIFSAIIILLLFAFSSKVHGQVLTKTFYDIYKTEVRESYYVNTKGEKEGTYKQYDRDGIVMQEANFKAGLLNGLLTIYSTSSGRQVITSKVNYLENLKSGMAYYYNSSGMVMKSGLYQDDLESGIWKFIDPYINFDLTDEEKKGCEYTTGQIMYKDGAPVYDGVIKVNFYPSNKPYTSATYVNGKKSGENITYFPNGKMYSDFMFDTLGQQLLMYKKFWYPNGNLQSFDSWETGNYIHEGYNKDGTKDYISQQLEISKKKDDDEKKIAQQNYLRAVFYGDSLINARSYPEAKKQFDGILYYYSNLASQSEIEKYKTQIKLIDSLIVLQIQQEKTALELPQKIKDGWKKITPKYCDVQTDWMGEYIILGVRRKKIIYEKIKQVYWTIEPSYSTALDDDVKDYAKAIENGNKLLRLLDIADKLADNPDTKEIEKQLKSALNDDDVKKIIGF